MWRPQSHPRIYVSFAEGDGRHHEQLTRHLAAAFAGRAWEASSHRSVLPGAAAADDISWNIVHADTVVVVATARYFHDSKTRVEMELALDRFLASEIHLIVVHAAACVLDPRLANATVLAPDSFVGRNREQFWRTCAARIAGACDVVPVGRPRYEDEENREIGEGLRVAWWLSFSCEGHDFSAVEAQQKRLRRGGKLRPGDVLGLRFHVRRRIGASPGAQWEGYDFQRRRPVEIHWIEPDELSSWRELGAAQLRRWVEFQHDAVAQTLTTLREEPGMEGAYFVVEKVSGVSLRSAVLDGRLSGARDLDVFAPLVDAVRAMRTRGLVHGGIATETIRVAAPDAKALWKIDCAARGSGGPALFSAGKSSTGDVVSLCRAILTCLHGAMLPASATAAQLREILQMCDVRPELKVLLARGLTSEAAGTIELDALGELLRSAPAQRMAGAMGWFDLETRSIAGGVSWLGAIPGDSRARQIEMPAHRVIVQGFELCAYPVTQRLYELMMGTNPSAYADECAPVHNVSFRDALSFCNRLSIQRGLQPAYVFEGSDVIWRPGADGYRLPTEAEWEHAAKGNKDTLFPWGSDEPAEQVCWNGHGNSFGFHNRKTPSPVWNHPQGATSNGLFDMVGNVWEWCWDWYAPFEDWADDGDDSIMEPIGPASCRTPAAPTAIAEGLYRVLRGGAWNLEDPGLLRTTMRSVDLETARDPDIGFRLARGAKPLARHVALRQPVTERPSSASERVATSWTG